MSLIERSEFVCQSCVSHRSLGHARDIRLEACVIIIIPSMVTQAEPWLILHYWTMPQLHSDGQSAATMSDVPEQCIPSCKQGSSWVEKTLKKDGRLSSVQLWTP